MLINESPCKLCFYQALRAGVLSQEGPPRLGFFHHLRLHLLKFSGIWLPHRLFGGPGIGSKRRYWRQEIGVSESRKMVSLAATQAS